MLHCWRRWIVTLCAAGCLSLWPPALPAEDAPAEPSAGASEVLAGHSYHGDVFNEGPRQQAHLMDGTGRVHFPTTTKDELAQQFINQGVGQLHGFWYFEAERSFRQAAMLDPECAIAYWGMAMANTKNKKRARGFIEEAVQRKSGAGERESMYIEALAEFLKAESGKDKDKERREAWTKALERICYKYPDDIEAKAFLGLALWENRSAGVPIASYLAVDALLGQVLEVNPLHPCHHYVIHLWDNEKPELALESAARCGESSPDVAHMWHMPGHIYSKLKRYREAVWQQEASARVDHAHMIRDRVLPDQIHNFAHNNEWLIRNLVHVGRARDAVELAKNMIELPRHPKYNMITRRGGSSHWGRMRLFDVLSEFELWDELIALADTSSLEPTGDVAEQIKRLRHVGRAHFRRGDLEQGRTLLAELEGRLKTLQAERDRKARAAEDKVHRDARRRWPQLAELPDADYRAFVEQRSGMQAMDARTLVERPYAGRLRPYTQATDELQGLAAVGEGRYKDALRLLKKAGGVDPLYLARVQLLSGDAAGAEKAAAGHVRTHENETVPLAHLVDIRWQAGQRDAAREAFEQLREISGPIDLQAPPFARLSPIAQELGWPEDWRLQQPYPADFGERPELASLGPFRWHPAEAEPWTLKDVSGHEHSLAGYHGRPVVVIFYLGHGCLHCAQQLDAFAPKTGEFEAAGVSLIAVSTDDQQSLQISIDNYQKGTFPFPLVSDADLEVFKSYRVYDDFERQPLHGTFLIDAEGLVRWHDISYEPFTNPGFVLNEARRLFAPWPAGGWESSVAAPRPQRSNEFPMETAGALQPSP